MVKFSRPNQPILEFKGEKVKMEAFLVSRMKARKLLRNNSHGYLAYLWHKLGEMLKLESVPVVKEFLDVFLEELMILPPKRYVEFSIELTPGDEPISRTHNRMTQEKLKVLKEQL